MQNVSPNNLRIVDIYSKYKKNEIVTRPYYQRRLVWTSADKEFFIETILKGYPFPEVYFCQGKVNTDTLTATDFVVDGQQRIMTIIAYIEGALQLKHIPFFNDLPQESKEQFLNYRVVIRNLGNLNDAEIKEIFNRLNKTDYTLNSTELLYAQYQGEFISTGKKIANEQSDFFEKIFGEKTISRMLDLNFILQIMTTLEHGIYFSSDSEIEDYIKLYNETYENKSTMYETITNGFLTFKALEFKMDSIFYKKAASFTLIVELCKRKKILDIALLSTKLNEFEENLLKNKNKDSETNHYAQFYLYIYQGTASKKARDFRGNMIGNILDNIG